MWKYGNMKVWKFNSAFLHSDSVIKILSSFLLLLLHGFKLCFPISEFLLRLLYWSKAHQQERRQHSGDFWQLFYLTINKIIHFVWQKRTFFILTQYKHFQVRVECRRCGELHKAYCQSLAWAANFCQLYLLKGTPVANFGSFLGKDLGTKLPWARRGPQKQNNRYPLQMMAVKVQY